MEQRISCKSATESAFTARQRSSSCRRRRSYSSRSSRSFSRWLPLGRHRASSSCDKHVNTYLLRLIFRTDATLKQKMKVLRFSTSHTETQQENTVQTLAHREAGHPAVQTPAHRPTDTGLTRACHIRLQPSFSLAETRMSPSPCRMHIQKQISKNEKGKRQETYLVAPPLEVEADIGNLNKRKEA